jgi:hypothetical protein
MMNELISPILELTNDVISRVLPGKKISDHELMTIKNQMNKAVLDYDWRRFESEVEDRVSARVLAQKELEKSGSFTKFLAGIHRPLWSIGTLLLFGWSLFSHQFGLIPIELTDAHKNIMMTVIIFYFGGRSVEKCLGKLG